MGFQVWLILSILSHPKVFSNGNIVFDDPKEFDDPQVFDGLKGISIGSMDFYINPKVNALVGSEILYFILCNIFCSKPKPHFILGLHSAYLKE